MKKIDRIYIATAFNNDGNHKVIIHFNNGSKYESAGYNTISEAINYMDFMKNKYGRSEAFEKRFQEWANFSEDKHPMK